MGRSMTLLPRALKPQKRLLRGEAHLSQVVADFGCKRVGGIHHPAERCLTLQFFSDPLHTPEGTNGHAFYRQPPVSLRCYWGYNTYPHPTMALKQGTGQAWTIAGSGQQPDTRLVKRGVVHQDVRRRKKQP